MTMNLLTHAAALTDGELLVRIESLAGHEREATAELIAHLAALDERPSAYAARGFGSLFAYCTEALHLSEDAAGNRIAAARAVRAHPEIIDLLLAGKLSPTTVRMLRKHLTPENHQELLAAASGKTKGQVEKLLACWFPQPDVPASVRKLPAPRLPVAHGDSEPATVATPAAPPSAGGSVDAVLPAWPELALVSEGGSPAGPAPSPRRPVVRPLSADRYEIRFTATVEMRERLREAQELLSHAVPSGDVAQVFDRALTVLVAELKRARLAATSGPRKSKGQKEDSRNIPAEVRREVWKRDGGRCVFVAADGRLCGSRHFVQFHHNDSPYGVGGKPTAGNIQLRCRSHNLHEADLFYGPGRRYAAGVSGGEGKGDGVSLVPAASITRSGTGDSLSARDPSATVPN